MDEPRSYGFPREKRLRKRTDFARAYAGGRSWSHPLVRVRVLPNRLGLTRFGFAVGKHVGKAVVRNLVKRRLREAVRQMAIQPGFDVVLSGRPAAAQRTYWELRKALEDVLTRAGLYSHLSSQ